MAKWIFSGQPIEIEIDQSKQDRANNVYTKISIYYNNKQYCTPKGYIYKGIHPSKQFNKIIKDRPMMKIGFVLHEYLYAKNSKYNLSKRTCDKILYHTILICGEDKLLAFLVYLGVRIIGFKTFKKYDVKI